MDHQLRIYTLAPQRLDAFLELWREHIVPARAAYGFSVITAMVDREKPEFVWVVRHDGDFAAADQAYYDSPERAALPWSPAEAITAMDLRMFDGVL